MLDTGSLRAYGDKFRRNAIFLTQQTCSSGTQTHFGGAPLLPPDFIWPEYGGRPLSFLAQIDCAEMHPLDQEQLLPEHGILSFFYELDSQKWGYDPQDAGCARVYWFAETSELHETAPPQMLAPEFRLPLISASAVRMFDLPSYSEGAAYYGLDALLPDEDNYDAFDEYERCRCGWENDIRIKLLGYADEIQGDMLYECEAVSRGYNLGSGPLSLPEAEQQEILEKAQDWILLFQLDTLETDNFYLMFGDSGRIYFFIRREDLAARRFDRVQLILQCF